MRTLRESPLFQKIYLDVAQFGRALPWGGRGRWFKSSHSDQPFCLKQKVHFAAWQSLKKWGDRRLPSSLSCGYWRVAQSVVSTRLLTEGLWVRVPPCQPYSSTVSINKSLGTLSSPSWGRSSAGRASALQAEGQGFNSPRFHHK